jgi:predicted site-specific integrase-resolvase
VNLAEWAHAQGIHVTTAYRWYREGRLSVPARKVGRLTLVSPETTAVPSPRGGAGLYARESAHDQGAGLGRQVARLAAWAEQAGLPVVRVEEEVGSGMNGARAKARRLLADPAATVVVVEHRDRLGRVNTELAEAALSAQGRRLAVLDDGEVTGDLVRDMIEVVTPFCARLYRGDEVAAQAMSGAIRYDVSYDPARDRWYIDASWRAQPVPAPALDDLRQAPVLAVDLNHGHLDAWMVTPDGNPAGPPVTIPLTLAGLPASRRDGRLRAAISELTRIARQHSCRAVVIEDLDFAAAREQGRERHGNRPSRGRRGRGFRRQVAGIPTGKFRDRLTQMASNAGVAVVATDPAYTSRWGREHWLAPLQDRASPAAPVAAHHAAAVVIGRRALGHRARRRAGVTGGGQRTGRRRAAPRAPAARRADRNGRPRKAQRQPPPWPKTATAKRTRPPDQAAQDRSGPPASQDHVQLAHQER